jgi:hypothetical protein
MRYIKKKKKKPDWHGGFLHFIFRHKSHRNSVINILTNNKSINLLFAIGDNIVSCDKMSCDKRDRNNRNKNIFSCKDRKYKNKFIFEIIWSDFLYI